MRRSFTVLKRIKCNKFISLANNEVVFKDGLNVVLGDSESSNSIGKSTLLMIVDFCFGGEDYIDKEKDTQLNVGEHTIFFEFVFNGESKYFSRGTSATEKDFVHVYSDSEFRQEKNKITLDYFKRGLSLFYGLNDTGLTFRAAVSRFFRIYNRNTHNELRPLNSTVREDDASGIESMLKLYKIHEMTQDVIDAFNKVADRKKVFDNLKRFGVAPIASSQAEYESNQIEIRKLQDEISRVLDDSKKGLSDQDMLEAEKKKELINIRKALRKERSKLVKKIDDIDFDKDYSPESITLQFEKLKDFFPGMEVNIEKLTQIETFHKKVKAVLSSEVKDMNKGIAEQLSLIDGQIAEIDTQLKDYKSVPTVADALLERHSELKTRLEELLKANKNYEEKRAIDLEYSETQKAFEGKVAGATTVLANRINSEMDRINNLFENGRLYAPELKINKFKSYSFSTPNDSGTGSRFKGVALFDLAVLHQTALPALIHDSIMFTNIEIPVAKKLIELYSQETKQIFIAFDHVDKTDGELKQLLTNNKILELSDEPYCLFGIQWNKKSKPQE